MVQRKIFRFIYGVAVACACSFWNPYALHGSSVHGPSGELVVDCAQETIGESETGGYNRSPWIDAALRLVGAPLGSPWCAATVAMWHFMSGYSFPHSAYCPDWFRREDCIYIRGEEEKEIIKPGDCGGIYFPAKKRIAHIFVVESVQGKWINTIEGNTNDGGSRDGDRIMRRKRLKNSVERFSRHWDKNKKQ